MLTMLFETGHPWITFKDPCNIRSPQRHVGVVHSSNLCTEITLNTSADEVAVCNLGSVNLAAHVDADGGRPRQAAAHGQDRDAHARQRDRHQFLHASRRRGTPTCVTARSGLGIMGFQDALQVLRMPIASDAAVEFRRSRAWRRSASTRSAASVDLAAERGRYPSFDGSLWSQGVLPIDSIELLAEARGGLELDRSSTLDWASLRERVKRIGMRNSNTMAIAPTATISNICGVSQSIEPAYQNLFVKSNMSGDFTVVNEALVRDLKARGLWDEVMVSDLKYFDGGVGRDRPHSGRSEGALCNRVRDRRDLADRGGGAPAEMDRPVAVSQPLYRQSLGQEA